ncbi:MAG: hypothetical protein D6798_00610 [Deltaproteobacteria bacterium]|nr:MAG: hypothetical protein D6798_00610 [Deltaproteobacteria bacterium]
MGPRAWRAVRHLEVTPEPGNVPAPIHIEVAGSMAFVSSAHAPTVGLVDLDAGVLADVFELPQMLEYPLLAADPDAGQLYVADRVLDAALRIDEATGDVSDVDLCLEAVMDLRWDSEGGVLWAAGRATDGFALMRIDADDGCEELPLPAEPLRIDVGDDRVVVSMRGSGSRGEIAALDAGSLEELARATTAAPLGSLVVDDGDDGDDAVLAATGSAIYRWSGEGLETVAAPADELGPLSVDEEGGVWTIHKHAGTDADTGLTWGDALRIVDGEVVASFHAGANSQFGAWAAEPGVMATTSEDTSEVWTTTIDGEQTRIQTGYTPSVVRTSPADPRRVAIIDRLGGTVQLFEGDERVASYDTDGWPNDLFWAPDGSSVTVYETGADRLVRLDADTWEAEVLFDDERSNTALVFGGMAVAGDVIYVAAGGLDVVRALTLDGELIWETALGDPLERTYPDDPGTFSVGVDGRGRIWTLRSRDAKVAVLDADGELLHQEWLPVDLKKDSLFTSPFEVYVGPHRMDLDRLTTDGRPDVDAERVLAIHGGRLLLDDGDGFHWQGGDTWDHSDEIYGGGHWAGFDPVTGGVWLSRFATGEVELVVDH